MLSSKCDKIFEKVLNPKTNDYMIRRRNNILDSYRRFEKKSNFVIFRPHQRKMDHSVNILMFDYSNHTLTSLECKDHVKYLGVLLDSHLSWKYHIDNVALKISRIIGVIARLRHLVPFTTQLSIYRSLILPYLSYGVAAWGQAAKYHLQKILVLQKRVLRSMYFSEPRAHAVPYLPPQKSFL